LRSFVVSGLDSVPGQRRILRGLSVREGNRFDRYAIDAAADSIRERLHNTGYPRGVAINSFYANDSALMAWDTIYVSPGPRTRIGAIDIDVTPMPNKKQQIPTKVVRQILGLDSGNLFREDQILDAQRAIYQTEAYQHVSITPDSGEDSVVALHVSLAEAAMHAARVGAGYGTLDCLRITGEYTDYNFLNGARRMDVTGRLSKIGIGSPTDFAPGLCPAAKNDVFSDSVNYYLGATLRQPLFLGLRTVPTITVYTQRQSEYNAYRRTTLIGGVASVLWRGLTRSPVNLSYSMDLGRTEAQPALFCAVFNLCDATEREKVQQTQRLAVLALGTTRNTSNSILSPTRGSTIHLETRYSGPVILSDSGLQFTKVLGDASRYISMGGGNVLAMRLRGGTFVGRRRADQRPRICAERAGFAAVCLSVVHRGSPARLRYRHDGSGQCLPQNRSRRWKHAPRRKSGDATAEPGAAGCSPDHSFHGRRRSVEPRWGDDTESRQAQGHSRSPVHRVFARGSRAGRHWLQSVQAAARSALLRSHQ
jgi:outer membrane translocation and assembly module TamA